ncbi:MAG: hypothetical protein CMJ70_24150 [Planctomycetaceae bacterium]|nr:hypothetical protein [Planctomycetaceae bacterium]
MAPRVACRTVCVVALLLACLGCIEPDNTGNSVDPNARLDGTMQGPNFRKMKNKLLPQFAGNASAALEEHGVEIRRDEQGRIIGINCRDTEITDAHLERLKPMIRLERLDLESCHYITDKGMVHLPAVRSLRRLSLRGTSITEAGLAHLQGMELVSLRIPESLRTDIGLQHYLRAIARRSRFHLDGWQITDAGLGHLQELVGLQSLSISDVPITDAGLAALLELSELRSIGLRNLAIGDAGLVHLARLSSLNQLVLIRTGVTATGIQSLQAALPNCRIVVVY